MNKRELQGYFDDRIEHLQIRTRIMLNELEKDVQELRIRVDGDMLDECPQHISMFQLHNIKAAADELDKMSQRLQILVEARRRYL